ncbi:nuclear transport factor 2 family protein [Amycolatopsis solani]|uniref:nuclear transport factor 2 family protein n=1 Tax=Amycolatopsis solani TaxID=3028615 RepID=UPI0025B199BD|nr:nuclear transport factor 2 family protein [Amycolatopsis sp. MEP2-6]
MNSAVQARCRRPDPAAIVLAQQVLLRFGTGDFAGVAQLLAPRVEWRGPTPEKPGGTCVVCTRRQVESFLSAFDSALTVAGLSVGRWVCEDDTVVVLGRIRCQAKTGGAETAYEFAVSLTAGAGLVDSCWLLAHPAGPAA